MNIKVLDSWLREYLKTDAKPQEIAKNLSLTSVSIERLEKYGDDYVYDIEVTTNRPDLMSVVGLAREAAAVLPQFGIKATFIPPTLQKPEIKSEVALTITNDPELVYRICAVVMEVKVQPSPKKVTERLETSDIRSLNNLIDVTNYVMRTIGHPTHVFDFDRLKTDKLVIRASKKGEEVKTLDGKTHLLQGGDIVAEDGSGRIVDLLGIMGLENSVVTDKTTRILFFIDNNDPIRMRKTSMSLAIRSEAAQLNEKEVDQELSYDALLYGIKCFSEFANGRVVSELIDIYPKKQTPKKITVSEEKINSVIGVKIPLKTDIAILTSLGFSVEEKKGVIIAIPPSWRASEMHIPEDLIEEIARVYGYHNLPSILPPDISEETLQQKSDPFFWEQRIKHALKYWGFTEVYTYSMVSEELLEGPLNEAVILKNPLDEEHVYMRKTLVPSLLQVLRENKAYKKISIFEIANIYEKNGNGLPKEKRMLAGIVKKDDLSFYEVKGYVEQLGVDLGFSFSFKLASQSLGADVYIGKDKVGTIEELDDDIVDFELEFEVLLAYASLKKKYTPLSKYPPVVEDIALEIDDDISTGQIIETIKKQSTTIKDVTLLDKYQTRRTFHIVYQSDTQNLSNEIVGEIRKNIISSLQNMKKK
ncbi:MAG: phenylalanine--tRNA ligase subunit beta [bacterium]|nr:phenylalanine--tRNA ligase subunit beta [bacterium]